MLLYLSSYKLGNEIEVLKNWIKENGNKIILIANSRDWSPENQAKEESIQRDESSLREIGFDVKRLDLTKYFGKQEKLKEDLENYHAFYVIGGNSFTLRLAMKYSGFDNYLKEISSDDKYLYAGYSAGICVLGPRLNGLDIVDEPINPYNNEELVFEGLDIIDFVPVPHYESNHPESHLIDVVVELFEVKEVKYKTLKDGEVIIMNKELKLVEPTLEYKEQVMEYRKIFLDNNENLSGCAELEDVSSYEEWIDFERRRSQIYGKEYVPSTVYLCIRAKDNKLVGIIDFRHDLTEFLLNYGGNIGYSIHPAERRKGYGTEMLRLMLIKCRELNKKRVLLTCDKQNIASAKIMIANGAILENEVVDESNLSKSGIIQRYWIEL